jgi:hypothetical protein
MQKLFYLLFDDAASDGTKLRESLCQSVVPIVESIGGSRVRVFGSDADVAAGKPIRHLDPPIRAMVSFWLTADVDREPVEEALAQNARGFAGYLVEESRPLSYVRPIGERTGGMKQVTCIAKRPDLTREEFKRIWHDEHCEVAIETQSTFGYVRNEIVRALTPDAPSHWSGIVEESFPIEALTDPKVFFDARSQGDYDRNVKRMVESCRRFLSFDLLEVTFVSEYYFG